MSFYPTHTICINDEEKIIKFERILKRTECKHKNIQISEEDNEVLCLDCNTKLNPIWWIKRHLEHLNSVTVRNNHILSEAREIWKKLENKNNFMCKHCNEINTIDFRKLPSKAAITRGLAVVEQDHNTGFTVEI